MRNLKFRVWDSENKEWATDFTISLNGHLLCDFGSTLYIPDNFIVSQWSGILDKNGVEIFEGDIIEIRTGMRFYVMFNEASFDLIGIPQDDYATKSLSLIKHYTHYAVIGNLYENPDLIVIASGSNISE